MSNLARCSCLFPARLCAVFPHKSCYNIVGLMCPKLPPVNQGSSGFCPRFECQPTAEKGTGLCPQTRQTVSSFFNESICRPSLCLKINQPTGTKSRWALSTGPLNAQLVACCTRTIYLPCLHAGIMSLWLRICMHGSVGRERSRRYTAATVLIGHNIGGTAPCSVLLSVLTALLWGMWININIDVK